MPSAPFCTQNLSPERQARLQALTRTPPLAWPTFLMWVVITLGTALTDYLAVTRAIPLWTGTLLNSLFGYLAFSVGHDAIHGSLSRQRRLNDWVGQLDLMLVAPYVNVKLFRWCHMIHHRNNGGPKDIDQVFLKSKWQMPFRWMFIDGFYMAYALKHGDKVSGPAVRKAAVAATLWFTMVGVLTYFGYGMEVLLLWFLPSRIVFFILGLTFFWLPHLPHETSQEENFTLASTIRVGHEWFMAPALQYQHVHLIHHLYPGTPFYNNGKVWKLLEPELRQQDLAIQHGFAVRPKIYRAAAVAAEKSPQ